MKVTNRERVGLCPFPRREGLFGGALTEEVTVVTSPDGQRFRECLGPELAPDRLSPDTEVWLGKGEPSLAGEHGQYRIGGHPYLHALCLLGIPVYIREKG